MKKIVVFVVFLIGFFILVEVQQVVCFGFQVSFVFNWMFIDKNFISINGINLGLKLGLMGEFYFQENYVLVMGLGFFFNIGGILLYFNIGIYWANFEVFVDCVFFMEEQQVFNLKYFIQYVEILIGLKMCIWEFGYICYFMEFNVGIGFCMQAKGDICNVDDVEECNDINIWLDVCLLNFFWGLNGGIEYSVLESIFLVVGIGLQFGFMDVIKDDDIVYLDNSVFNQDNEDSKGVVWGVVLWLGVLFQRGFYVKAVKEEFCKGCSVRGVFGMFCVFCVFFSVCCVEFLQWILCKGCKGRVL